MGKLTHIQWTHSSANPTGFQCAGCELWIPGRNIKKCYAGQWAERLGGEGAFDKPSVLKPGVVAKAASWGPPTKREREAKPWIPAHLPRMVFVGDMADIFSPTVPFEFLRDEVILAAASPNGSRHIWQLSTKQANRLVEFAQWLTAQKIDWPKNIWMGVSVTSPKTLWRVERLIEVPCSRRYVNFAPAWEWVDFSPYAGRIHQVIVEGESQGPGDTALFDTAIAYSTIATCRAVGIAPFIKQLGAAPYSRGPMGGMIPIVLKDNTHGGNWDEWPAVLKVREFPTPA